MDAEETYSVMSEELSDVESEVSEINNEEVSFEQVSRPGKPRPQLQATVRMNRDIVKFISKRMMYSQQLNKQLKKLLVEEVLLIPEKSEIKVTKKASWHRVENWKKRCCTTVRKFCSRFGKECFELVEPNSVRKGLPKLGGMLHSTTAAYWIEDNNTKLAVMSDKHERDQVLAKVREFLSLYNTPNDGKKESSVGFPLETIPHFSFFITVT